ncbi:sigma-70 family RNA polymerase sigma factor [Anaeromyxobacter paludicola]|uniref:RNA polymerase sigma factor n=1 Tax=Anaeromyxobacter paludicola TaxID=2918171 RepID=A0ABM7X9M8_9BACT|nr:sigma-70 family RNA polymerase sigma factor [Anaeromyxobacter paludicola]BDG08542.1 RNA polymerase sigma factor RpoH [Anaeromyxobacter paludicola]
MTKVTKGKITREELASVAPYLEAARALRPIGPEEERALAERARAGEVAARDELVRRHLPLVIAFARKQSRGELRLDELVQEGNLGLLRAVEKFDPSAGTRFSTYALWWIRAYVWKHLRQARSSVRPRSGTAARSDLSLDATVGEEEGDVTYLERVPDEAPSPDARYATAEGDARVRLALEKVRGRIGELGWDIVQRRLRQDPPDTLTEIGERWGLSRERVRQVELRTKAFLRDYLRPANDERQEAA